MIKQTPAYLTPGGMLCSSQQEAQDHMEGEIRSLLRTNLEAYVGPQYMDLVVANILSDLSKKGYLS